MSKINSITEAASFLNNIKEHDASENYEPLKEWLNGLNERQKRPKGRGNFKEEIRIDLEKYLEEAGVGKSAKICEIGGPFNSFSNLMPEYDFEFLSLFPAEGHDNIVVADATQCDYVESEKYDAIISISVFEHISKPWKAAENLTRLLKPGGIVYHVAPFSYFYHGAPADFWRFTPDAFEQLFNELRPLKSEFYGGNRRRDNQGSAANRVDRDGGEQFAVDEFGGWRENWHTVFVGRKDAEYKEERLAEAKMQTVINLLNIQFKNGSSRVMALNRVHAVVNKLFVNADQEISIVDKKDSNFNLSRADIIAMAKSKTINGKTIQPSYNKFVMAKQLGWKLTL